MGELEDKLNAILGDPQAMGQILSMARALGGGGPDPPAAPEESSDPSGTKETPPPPHTELEQLLGDLDPDLLGKGLTLMQALRSGDQRREDLLNALVPYLSPQRRERLERARRIIRLSRAAALALELFRENGGEIDHV